MMAKQIDYRERIHYRVRKIVKGTGERPRIAVYRSLKHMHIQAIDDKSGRTIISASSVEKGLKGKFKKKKKTEVAAELGKIMGERLKEKGIKTIVFDRGGFHYHGRVKAAAENIRAAGILF
jgi:large subunit ribosomal protein L18